jgi:hypothetical protein
MSSDSPPNLAVPINADNYSARLTASGSVLESLGANARHIYGGRAMIVPLVHQTLSADGLRRVTRARIIPESFFAEKRSFPAKLPGASENHQ